MESFSPQNYVSKNASNEILFNMKVVDLALTFPKKAKNMNFSFVVGKLWIDLSTKKLNFKVA
jgi:hypothetical protein